jgi:integrase
VATRWSGTWAGGRKYVSNGRTVFVIERMRLGRRYTQRLDAGSEPEALAELALFERDPDGYVTRREELERRAANAVLLGAESAARFLGWLEANGRTERYRRNVKSYLAHWARVLGNRDLRTLTLQDLRRALASWDTARKARIIALKSFFSYLRNEEGALSPAEDATLSLKVPPARPSKALAARAYDVALVERFYGAIASQAVRDLVCVLAKTGMHATEVDRVARGEGELRALRGHGEIAGLARLVHRNGEEHLQALDAQALAALRRLVARGQAPVDSFVRKEMLEAARSIRERPLKIGRLRHSFIAWATTVGEEVRPTSGGVPLETVATIVGHRSPRTTRMFHRGWTVPPMVRLPIRLEHPEDPAAIGHAGGRPVEA